MEPRRFLSSLLRWRLFGLRLALGRLGRPVGDRLLQFGERVEQSVRDFRGTAEPFDDATMMALRIEE